jgi:protein-L-isoaspartate(D-aspartate) O-methyltransferase
MPDYAVARRNMVDSQLRTNRVTNPAVIAAMEAIPRERFVPLELAGVAYVDDDLAIGRGRYLTEPMVLARLLQEADIRPGEVVLDIGCGAGYSTAVAAHLANTVFGLEADPGLARKVTETLAALDIDNAVVVEGPLAAGYPAHAPYDVILIAGSVPEIPAAIAGQLAEGGRLVAVVSPDGRTGRAVLAARRGGVVSQRDLFDAATPPLPGFAQPAGFRF